MSDEETKALEEPLDLEDITLDGEEDREVEVYDTCDVVRKKIRNFLDANPLITQTRFCKEISQTYERYASMDRKKVSQTVFKAFVAKEGPTEGITSAAFYASYVFFEKVRIRDGEPKTVFREEMEKIYDGLKWEGMEYYNGGNPGLDISKKPGRNFICLVGGKEPYEDEYGVIHML